MATKLSLVEQETIIGYDNDDDTATVSTYDRKLIRKLNAYCERSDEITSKRLNDECMSYTFPKKWVTVRMPRQMSDEQRAELAERARQNFGGNR